MIKWHTGTFLTVLRSRPLSAALAPAAGLPILAAPATAPAKKKKTCSGSAAPIVS